jgi:MFS family permease
LKAIPRGVWVLGFVSLFMDVSSEMIHSVLPLFVVGTLGASAVMLGLLEGVAEATAQFSRLWSGVLSDRWQSRKGLALLGYGLAAVVKPLFPMAESVTGVFAARFADRIGKGIRGSPRDAMVADFTPPELRGAAFGLRQSLDTIGAIAGPLIAVALIGVFLVDVRFVLWAACVPALIAVAILVIGISEPPVTSPVAKKSAIDLATFRNLGSPFWWVAILGAAVMLARFSEAFLVLKAASTGMATAYVPLVMVVMGVVYALSAYPVGVVSDRYGRVSLLAFGLVVLIAADVVLAQSSSVAVMFAGVALWGLHMGLTQGILTSLVADKAPADLRATAFGAFSVVSGVATLLASVIAGYVWDQYGSEWVFYTGAAFAVVAVMMCARFSGYASSSHQ